MKLYLLLPFLLVGFKPADNPSKPTIASFPDSKGRIMNIGNQTELGPNKMRSVVFKTQEYCRVELKDFEFDAPFSVLGAKVYFTGANFSNTEQGSITSNSLKPIRTLMDRCVPGSIIIFDEVKVMGPDNQARTIPGLTVILY